MDPKNFDIANMTPQQMRAMFNMVKMMPEQQLTAMMKQMGVSLAPDQLKLFIEKISSSSDEELNMLKEQFKSGKINMSQFGQQQAKPPEPENPFKKYDEQLKEAKQLMSENKFNESIELCNKYIDEVKNAPCEEKDNENKKKCIGDFYDQLTLSRYTSQDYDTTIAECLKFIEDIPVFSVINRMGICYFKKGRHVKARDAFMKAKNLFPNETDNIAEKYLKMALEEIENY